MRLISFLFLVCISQYCFSQRYVVGPVGTRVPEQGFLPGKKFAFYPTIDKYHFENLTVRVELVDKRAELGLTKIDCSAIELANESEFAGSTGASKVYEYFQRLFAEANIIIDSNSNNVVTAELQALDIRLPGFGYITAHGLCQLKIQYKNIASTYCIDITDKDKHSPISRFAFVTRKTATRVIVSAAIREAIEKFLLELKSSNI